MRFLVLALVALALLACTAPDESLHYQLPAKSADAVLEFSIVPESIVLPEPEPSTTLADALDSKPMQPDAMWRVLEEPNAWLSDHTGLASCDAHLPRFPALSRNGDRLALALATAPVADEHAAAVRIYRVADGTLLGSYWLLHPSQSKLIEADPTRIQQRYCKRTTELSRLLGDDYEPMPKTGGWQNPIREGLPESRDPWPLVVADGATREVDATVADIVIANPLAPDPALQPRSRAQRCHNMWEQFSTVWSTAELSVLTRGPCGC
jgi:hypothetical protein